MTPKPAVTKKAPRAAAKPATKTKRTPATQTTLDDLLKASNAHALRTEQIIDMLSEDRKARALAVVDRASSAISASIAVENSNARLDAVLEIICGKGAQHFIQDIWDLGRPPTREMILRKADEVIARTGRRVG